ncbi:MAG: hypothetical protein ACHQFX_03350 [Chitinophagales bacterium]
MKKMIVVAVLLVNVLGANLFAADDEITREAKEAFKKEFPTAEGAKWEELKAHGLYMVKFIYEDRGHVAYVDPEGTVVASARMVNAATLPFTISQAIRKTYSYTEILKVEELTMGNSLSYFFTIEHEGSRIELRVYPDGSIHKFSKKKGSKKGF